MGIKLPNPPPLENLPQEFRDWLKVVQQRIERIGVLRLSQVEVTTTYRALTTDTFIKADATAGVFTVTLPLARSAEEQVIIVKKIDVSANAVTVDGNGAETIDGAATKPLAAQFDFIVVVSDGDEWHVIG